MACVSGGRGPRRLAVLVVSVALLLDSLLLTVIVPIAPMALSALEASGNSSRGAAVAPPGLNGSVQGLTPSSLGPLGNTTVNTSRPPEDNPVLQQRDFKVGALLASKAVVELLATPFVGPLTNRIGFNIPMFAGLLVLFASTIMYSFSGTFALMVVARALQGVGSALTFAPGLGLLASVFPDDAERGGAIGVALGGLALGVVCGPPFGSVMYEFVGKSAPFLTLAGLALLDGVLQLFVLKYSQMSHQNVIGTSLFTLLRDPYILLCAGGLCFSNMAVAILEATLPMWMIQTMHTPHWQLGMPYLPASVSYLIVTSLFGVLANKMGRWLCSVLGMVLVGVSLMCVPLAKNIYILIAPNAGVGIALGMVEAALMPIMAHLVDIRHVSVYGTVFAISDVALCVGFAVGPLAGGALVQAITFPMLMVFIGVINIAFSPLCYFLKDPPPAEEKMALVDQEFVVQSYDSDKPCSEFPLNDEGNTKEQQ